MRATRDLAPLRLSTGKKTAHYLPASILGDRSNADRPLPLALADTRVTCERAHVALRISNCERRDPCRDLEPVCERADTFHRDIDGNRRSTSSGLVAARARDDACGSARKYLDQACQSSGSNGSRRCVREPHRRLRSRGIGPGLENHRWWHDVEGNPQSRLSLLLLRYLRCRAESCCLRIR